MRIAILILLAGMFLACENTNTTDTAAGAKTDGKISTKVVSKKISPLQLEQLLAKSPDAQLVDVRTPAEYEAGTIKDAVNMDVRAADFEKQIETLEKDQPVFLFCRSGGRSARAASQLEDMGFTTIYDMSDGYLGWGKMQEQPKLDPKPVEQ